MNINIHENIKYGDPNDFNTSNDIKTSKDNANDLDKITKQTSKLGIDKKEITKETPLKGKINEQNLKYGNIDDFEVPKEGVSVEQNKDQLIKNIEKVFTIVNEDISNSEKIKEVYFSPTLVSALGEIKSQNLINHLQNFTNDYFNKIKTEDKSLIVDAENFKFLVKKSGKIYLHILELGKGSFKTTDKYLLVANITNDMQNNSDVIFRAFSLPKDNLRGSQKIKAQNENERETLFNNFLKMQSKEKNLSHVNLIKSIVSINKSQSIRKSQICGMMSESFESDVDVYLKTHTLPPKKLNEIALQMAQSVKELHEIGVFHRDIKPDNFLIKKDQDDFIVKITDFGRSSGPGEYRYADTSFFNLITDPLWKNLEADDPLFFSEASEIYQLGMTLAMILTETPLSEAEKLCEEELKSNTYSDWKKNPENWKMINKFQNVGDKEFILRMLNPINPSNRPSIDEVIEFLSTRGKKFNQ